MRHRRLPRLILLSVVLLPLFASSAEPRTVRSLESILWTIDLTTISSRVEAGALGHFDSGFLRAASGGARLQADGKGVEEWTSGSAPKGGFFEAPALASLRTSSTTELTITCKPGAAFYNASASGSGRYSITFDDGFRSLLSGRIVNPADIFLGSTGTGFAKVSLGFRASGDLEYDPTGEAAGVAESVGDVPTDLTGSVDLPGGVSLSYTPHEGEGTHTDSLGPRDDTSSSQKQTFQVKIQNHVGLALKAADQMLGEAHASGFGRVVHDVEVSGESCRDTEHNLESTLALKLRVERDSTVADVSITTRVIGGATIEQISRKLRPVEAKYYRTHVRTSEDSNWGPPSKEWRSAAAATKRPAIAATPEARHRLGVRRGSAARYAVATRQQPLRNVRQIRLGVTKANRRTGALTLDTRLRYRGGRTARGRLATNVFTGRGDLRMFVVPTNLRKGQRLYGIGRVAALNPSRVRVEYRQGRARLSAVYDRRTGWLVAMLGRSSGRSTLAIVRRG